jgi:hypothetical protein
LGPESGHTGQHAAHGRRDRSFPLSSIRTFTVGFGFQPNLLTPPALSSGRALAGSGWGAKETLQAITAGGDFRPALRTFTVQIDGKPLWRYGTVSTRAEPFDNAMAPPLAAHGSIPGSWRRRSDSRRL